MDPRGGMGSGAVRGGEGAGAEGQRLIYLMGKAGGVFYVGVPPVRKECNGMLVTLEEMKNYLRVDDGEDDGLIATLLASAERMCMDVLRTDEESGLQEAENGKTAVMYTVAYLYEHREEADHHALTLTLRSLLFGSRKEAF